MSGAAFGASALGSGIQATNNLLATGLNIYGNYKIAEYNNREARLREAEARAENYKYGEHAANAADARTRQLYEDLYSPAAQLKQLKEAGLSPSLFYGDGGGLSGQAGAQGTGAAGISPTVFGMAGMNLPPVDVAGIRLANAQADKATAEANNINTDTKVKSIELAIKEIENKTLQTEFTLNNAQVYNTDGTSSSLYEIADVCYTYDQFLKRVRESADKSERYDIREITETELGQKVLRSMYEGFNKFHTDIATLSNERVNANFLEEITLKLRDNDFANLNAKDACNKLEASIAQNVLDAEQRKAWQNILRRLGNSGDTAHDVLIVLGLIVDRYLTQMKVTSNTRNVTINK